AAPAGPRQGGIPSWQMNRGLTTRTCRDLSVSPTARMIASESAADCAAAEAGTPHTSRASSVRGCVSFGAMGHHRGWSSADPGFPDSCEREPALGAVGGDRSADVLGGPDARERLANESEDPRPVHGERLPPDSPR